MKRVKMIYLCVLSMPILLGSIIQTSSYYNKMDNTNIELVESKSDTVAKEEIKPIETVKEVIKEQTKTEIDIEVTAYCDCSICTGKYSKNYGLTTSGEKTHSGVIAIPKELKLGTKIVMPTFSKYSGNAESKFTGLDRGGAIIKKNGVYVIDMWVSSHKEALKIGRVRTKGWIVKE